MLRFLPCQNNTIRGRRVFIPDCALTGVPELSSLATVEFCSNSANVVFTGAAFMDNSRITTESSGWQQCSQVSKSVPDILSDVHLVDDGEGLARAIAEKKCRMVCDGSYHPEYKIATMAVIIESSEGIPLGRGYCRVPGPASAQNSYRAELFGIYVTLCTVEATVTKYHINDGHIQLHCDNLWSINKSIFAKSRVEGINTHHYDLLT